MRFGRIGRWLGCAALGVMFGAVADPASAYWRKVQGGIRLDGPVDQAFHGAFLHSLWSAALSEPRGRAIGLWLNSTGGTLDEALRVGQVIRDLQADGVRVATLVGGSGQCDLPCLVIFAMGQERYVGEGARIHLELAGVLAEQPEQVTAQLVTVLADADAQFAARVLSQETQALSGTELVANFPEFTRPLR